jgi:hypothetical protein
MSDWTLDVRSHLESLVGQPVRTPTGPTMAVLDVQDNVAVVGGRAGIEVILIGWVQWAVDRFLSSGEVHLAADAFGASTETVVALLLTLPGAQAREDGAVVLEGAPAWNIRTGEAVDRPALHARFGGNSRTRIAPSGSTPNVFVFVDTCNEEAGLWKDGVLHLLGERVRRNGQSNANRALANHRSSGRVVRVFWRSGEQVFYAGEFETDLREPFYFVDGESGEGALERRIVFRLVPTGTRFEMIEAAPALTPHDEGAEPTEAAEQAMPSERRHQAALQAIRKVGVRGPWPMIVLASCAAIALTTWGWTSAPVRPVVTMWFLLLCPGMALVSLLPDRGLLLRLVLAVAASLALETLVATFMLEAKAWAPGATLVILLLITVAATALDLRERPLPRWVRG